MWVPSRGVLAGLVAVLLLASGWYAFVRPPAVLTVTATFATTDGLFPGNKVDLLGIPVGNVVSVQPQGPTVRVVMTLPSDTQVPVEAHAYIMSPDVISDRYIELTPVYRGGALLTDGAQIPLERTHAPIAWDKLAKAVDGLLATLGPTPEHPDGTLGPLLRTTALSLDGNGEKVRDAIATINQASSVLVGDTPDITAALSSFGKLVDMLQTHQASIDQLARSVSALSDEFGAEQERITDTVTDLADVLDQVNALVRDRSGQLTGTVAHLAAVSENLARLRQRLVDTLDVAPTTFQNVSNAVDADGSLRLRLDVSTQLQQFAAGQAVCKALPLPLCNGPGLANPIPVPVPEAVDPLGLLNFPRSGR
ncbi:MCE family protein [Pseudonocardia sp. GCM10023141]|uniref:MCE family protein n=1 Tax=Pseudonocardia sp. GCM10023141 TaxID=3252653 RepID=UPI00360A80CE